MFSNPIEGGECQIQGEEDQRFGTFIFALVNLAECYHNIATSNKEIPLVREMTPREFLAEVKDM